MRDLSNEEREELARRRAGFEDFFSELMPVLVDFAERLNLLEPQMILTDPERHLETIDAFMERQVVKPEDRSWILTRLGYYVGEILVHRLGGCWFLCEAPSSRYFLRYVVGKFSRVRNPNAILDPFQVAAAYLDDLPRCRLPELLREVENELKNA